MSSVYFWYLLSKGFEKKMLWLLAFWFTFFENFVAVLLILLLKE